MQQIIDRIRQKTRDEWQNLAREFYINLRIWIQENGEKAFFVGVFLGILILAFFKLFLTLVLLAALLGLGVWYTAKPAEIGSPVVQNGSSPHGGEDLKGHHDDTKHN